MRKSLFYLALLLVACSGNESAAPGTEQPPAPHVPVITNVALSPDSMNSAIQRRERSLRTS